MMFTLQNVNNESPNYAFTEFSFSTLNVSYKVQNIYHMLTHLYPHGMCRSLDEIFIISLAM